MQCTAGRWSMGGRRKQTKTVTGRSIRVSRQCLGSAPPTKWRQKLGLRPCHVSRSYAAAMRVLAMFVAMRFLRLSRCSCSARAGVGCSKSRDHRGHKRGRRSTVKPTPFGVMRQFHQPRVSSRNID
jgi:hypothetical protein